MQASNTGALALYEKLGFARDEKMTKYYLNGGDAYRLKLWIAKPPNLDEDNTDSLSATTTSTAAVV